MIISTGPMMPTSAPKWKSFPFTVNFELETTSTLFELPKLNRDEQVISESMNSRRENAADIPSMPPLE